MVGSLQLSWCQYLESLSVLDGRLFSALFILVNSPERNNGDKRSSTSAPSWKQKRRPSSSRRRDSYKAGERQSGWDFHQRSLLIGTSGRWLKGVARVAGLRNAQVVGVRPAHAQLLPADPIFHAGTKQRLERNHGQVPYITETNGGCVIATLEM